MNCLEIMIQSIKTWMYQMNLLFLILNKVSLLQIVAEFCSFLFHFCVVLGDAGVYDYFKSIICFYF